MTRIHITGGPGSGKTYLAQRIADGTNQPVYHLDDLFWENSSHTFGRKADPQVREERLRRIIASESWIIEGVYSKWLGESFEQADLIIVLDTNVLIRDARIVRRFLKRKLKLAPCNKRETVKGLLELLRWNHHFDAKDGTEAKQMTERYDYKKVTIHNRREWRSFVNNGPF